MNALWTPQYYQKVLALNPIAYWMQDEKSGAVAYDMVAENEAQNGAYTGVTLAQPGIGDGRTSPLYDGANDFLNVQTATLAGRFSGVEGSIALWGRVANVGVWSDATARQLFYFQANVGSYIAAARAAAANNAIDVAHSGGGTFDSYRMTVGPTIDWFHICMTWDQPGDLIVYYLNGTQVSTDVGIGVWAGALSIALIGAQNLAPTAVWSGYLAHYAVWDRELASGEVSTLAIRQ